MIGIPEDDRIERASEPTTLGELRVGDLVAGWLGLCLVTCSEPRPMSRHYVEFTGRGESGMELGPSDAPWRRVPAGGTAGGEQDAAAAVS